MIGNTVSHYKILEKLGEGGMGEVYLAEDTKLDRAVALKFLRPEAIGDPVAKERFTREAKAASALNHRNITTIYEIDEWQTRQFICMEYVEGYSIKQKVKSAPLTIADVIDITKQLAAALKEAHEHSIVHRDIKADNIMVTAKGEVKVMDFGIAKFRVIETVTKTGTTMGTVSYMSPEQARGENVDDKSDIWSMGVVLYEMLTGKLPFKGDHESAIMYSILNKTPESVTDLRDDIPKSLEQIVTKSLEKNAADRYQHADELIADLHKIEEDSDSKVAVLKSKVVVNYAKKLLRNKLLPAVFIIIIIVIAGGYFIFNRFVTEDAPESGKMAEVQWTNSIAILPFENISADPTQEYFCGGIADQLRTSLSGLKDLKMTGRTSVNQYKNTKKTIPQIGEELNVSYIMEGSASKFGNDIRVNVKLLETKEGTQIWADTYSYEYKLSGLFNIIDNTSEKVAKALIKNLSIEEIAELKADKPRNVETFEYYTKGLYFFRRFSSTRNVEDFQNAENMFKKAIELDPKYIPSYTELAELYTTYAWYKTATIPEMETYWAQARALNKIAFDLDPNSPEANVVMGKLYEINDTIPDNMVKAFEKFKKAIELNPSCIPCNHAMAITLGDVGLYDIALKYHNRVVDLDPLWPEAYTSRAYWGYSCLGEYEKAESDFQMALDLDQNHQLTLILFSQFLIRTKKYEKAKEYCLRWSKKDTSSLMPRAFIHAFEGNQEEAINLTKKSKTWIGFRYIYINWIYTVLGKEEEAIEYLNKQIKVFVDGGWPLYLMLLHDPIYDDYRDDPRFLEILAKHKELYEENKQKYGGIL